MVRKIFEKLGTKVILLTLTLLLVISAGGAVYFYKELRKTQKDTTYEVQDVLKQVSRHMILPDGTPTVATVTDPERLKDQSFFVNAKTDDKVLIYTNARKAILYRPSEDKIIEVAPLNIGQQ